MEIVRNRRMVALGLVIAVTGGASLSGCGVDKESLKTLQQHREADPSAVNRFRVDYGGYVEELIDEKTGGIWHTRAKKQCLLDSMYGSYNRNTRVEIDTEDSDRIHVSSSRTNQELNFTGFNDTSRRLEPADEFTAQVLKASGCVVTDY